MSVLVVIDHDRGDAAAPTWSALTAGRELGLKIGVGVEALIIGESAAALAKDAAGHGASVVHIARHDILTDFGPEAWGETVAQTASACGAIVVVAPGTERGNEVMAQAAVRMGQAMVANVISVEPGEPWTLIRVRWGGSLLEETRLEGDVKLLTYSTTAVEAVPAPVTAETHVFEPTLGDEHARSVIRDRVVLTAGVTLATAPVVVSGGRGVGSAEAFGILEELAGLLDGVVGCSRVATNNGWRPHSDQVGQTGTKIAPKLYIACGISGAIQHWVGAMGSKQILAINTDPEANMVTKADYAVIGDLHEIIPAITAEIQRRRG